MPSSELAAGSSPAPCSPDGLEHSHSVYAYFNASSNLSSVTKKEHMSKKICQTLRRKLSAINKLRVRLQGAGSTRPEAKEIDSTVVSDHAGVSRRQMADHPTPELDAFYYLPHTTDIAAQQSRLHVTQAELAVDSVHELPCMQSTTAAADSENAPPQRNSVPEAPARSSPYPQPSMVSALSSEWNSSGSERWSSWQTSQRSFVSGITPNTSLSETDQGHDGPTYSASYDSVASSTQPLSLEAHLAVPHASFVDGSLTESPTSGDLPDFSFQQQIAELDTAAAHPWSGSQEHDDVAADSCEMRQPPEPEELVLSSSPFPNLLVDSDKQVDLLDESPPEYATWEPAIHTTDGIPAQFLTACRQYAKSISDECHNDVKTVLETAFEVTKLYYLKGAEVAGRTPPKTLKEVWTKPPTIEAGLQGMNCLLTNDAAPTVCELMSLGFLSLALLGISLNIGDLAIVVRLLHHQARSWSNLILAKQERRWFEDFIDDLWLLAEQGQRQTRLSVAANEPPFRADTITLSLMDSNDFVVQTAQIFIHC